VAAEWFLDEKIPTPVPSSAPSQSQTLLFNCSSPSTIFSPLSNLPHSLSPPMAKRPFP